MHWPAFITFASDATIVGLWALVCLLMALIALAADWRRARRRQLDRVGCMPWTPLFLLFATLASGLLLVAIRGWLSG
jgi:hypothetical protein